jgi:ribosomal protein S27E
MDRTQGTAREKHQMITIECPWCNEPAVVEPISHHEISCDTCGITVEIAPERQAAWMDRAA